LVEQVPRKD